MILYSTYDYSICEACRLRRLTKQKYAPLVARQFLNSPQKNLWYALRATKEKAARSGDNFQFSSEMVAMYAKARTYFERKS